MKCVKQTIGETEERGLELRVESCSREFLRGDRSSRSYTHDADRIGSQASILYYINAGMDEESYCLGAVCSKVCVESTQVPIVLDSYSGE